MTKTFETNGTEFLELQAQFDIFNIEEANINDFIISLEKDAETSGETKKRIIDSKICSLIEDLEHLMRSRRVTLGKMKQFRAAN